MSGLVLFLVLFVFTLFLYGLYFFSQKIPSFQFNKSVVVVLLVALMPLPVVDEVFGFIKFNRLCSDNLFLTLDKNSLYGENLFSSGGDSRIVVADPIVIIEKVSLFRRVEDGEVVVKWNSFHAKGGWLSRSLNLFQSNQPYIFDGVCISDQWSKSIFSDLNVNVDYR